MTNTSTLPEITGTLLHGRRYSVWRTLRLWILVIVLLLMTSNGLWPPHPSPNLNPFVPLDQTTIVVPQHQVDQRVVLIYQNNADGTLIRVLAHPDRYSEFVHQQVAKLEVARLQGREQVKVQFTDDLKIIFDEVSFVPRWGSCGWPRALARRVWKRPASAPCAWAPAVTKVWTRS